MNALNDPCELEKSGHGHDEPRQCAVLTNSTTRKFQIEDSHEPNAYSIPSSDVVLSLDDVG
jgi:hypothetical protein